MNTAPKKRRSKQTPATKADAVAAKLTFEQALDALEQVVQELEQGELGLSDSLARYEQGVKHLRQCFRQLEAAERRVELLKGIDDEGQPIGDPYDERTMSLEEKAASRGARRSSGSSTRRKAPRDADAVDGSGELF